MRNIILPTLAELKRRGIDYKGFLYAGLMINEQKIKVLEYNCRFGDPETQPILMRMKSDFLDLCLKAAKQELKGEQIEWDERFALGVVMASKGYPEKYETGFPISGIVEENEAIKVFHCGTKKEADEILSNGGRVLCVTGLGSDLNSAFEKAYEAISKISWDGAFYRKDIGKRNQ
jgi:phosphoribosylamine--glycine ligase